MKTRVLFCFFCLGFVLATSHAEEVTPLPIYPGSKVTFELNLRQDNFLPAVRRLIALCPLFSQLAERAAVQTSRGEPQEESDGLQGPKIPPDFAQVMFKQMSQEIAKSLPEALKGLECVSVAFYEVPRGIKPSQVLDFYMQKIGLTKGWQSVFRIEVGQVIRIYAKPGLEGLFMFAQQDNKVVAVRTNGKIDIDLIAQILAKYAPALSGVTQSGRPEPPSSQTSPPPGQSAEPTTGETHPAVE